MIRLTTLRLPSVVLAAVGVLASCSSTDIDTGSAPAIAAALDDRYGDFRTVSVYLTADRELGFAPTYIDRIIYAEPVIESTAVRAQATTSVQGINTVIVGDSCEALNQKYTDLTSCQLVTTSANHYGDAEATAATDSEGFAALTVGAGRYRVTMQSWVTDEDQKCSWSGSEILSESDRSLELPMMVFCE